MWSTRCVQGLFIAALFAGVVLFGGTAGSTHAEGSEAVVIADGYILAGHLTTVGPGAVTGAEGQTMVGLPMSGGFRFDAAAYNGWTIWTQTETSAEDAFALRPRFLDDGNSLAHECGHVTLALFPLEGGIVDFDGDIDPCVVPAGADHIDIIADHGVDLAVTVWGRAPPVPPTPVDPSDPFAVVRLTFAASGPSVMNPGEEMTVYTARDINVTGLAGQRLTTVTRDDFGLGYRLEGDFSSPEGAELGSCAQDGPELDCVIPEDATMLRLWARQAFQVVVSLYAEPQP